MAAEDVITGKKCQKCGALKDLSEFHILASSPDGHQPRCKHCACAATREWYLRNRDTVLVASRAYFQKNKDTLSAKNAEWQRENRELVSAYGKKYRGANKEKERLRAARYREAHKESALEYRRRYRDENRDKLNLWDANRRAAELRATPAWANEFFIAEAYRLAKLREKVCGGKWHVDHVVPLQSQVVCGLHVEHNLQVIPQSHNQRKSNRHWPDMP